MVTFIFFFFFNFGAQFIPFTLGKFKQKFFWRENKIKLKACTKLVIPGFKLWPWKDRLKKCFESKLIKFVWFCHKLNIQIVSYAWDFLPIKFFFKCYFKSFASINCSKMYLNDKMMHVISASTGINGVSLAHYISYTGTATYLVYCIFWNRHQVGNIMN